MLNYGIRENFVDCLGGKSDLICELCPQRELFGDRPEVVEDGHTRAVDEIGIAKGK